MHSSTLLLTGQFVSSDLAAEFGQVPSSFVPIQNSRLYELQISTIREAYGDTNLIVTLPANYLIPEHDSLQLSQQNAKIHWSDPEHSLLEAVRDVWKSHDVLQDSSQVQILFGDTLFDNLSSGPDTIFVGRDTAGLKWHRENQDYLWAGFFTIANTQYFGECLGSLEPTSFEQVIEKYRQRIPMRIKPMSVWLDFGNITTYYRSRSTKVSHRAFNNISVRGTKLTKFSKNQNKIAAESNWYNNVPEALREHTPKLIVPFSKDSQSYSIEYLHCTTLSDLYVFGELEPDRWEAIFSSIREYLEKSANFSPTHHSAMFQETLSIKSMPALLKKRLYEFEKLKIIPIDQQITLNGCSPISLTELANKLLCQIENMTPIPGYIHGDLCFSNMLFDTRSEQIKVIDPRGLNFNQRLTTYGDLNYDIAKLLHSAIGAYDHILGSRFQINELKQNKYELVISHSAKFPAYQQIFNRVFGDIIEERALYSLTALLFVSMLPLHYEAPERQRALAFRAIQMAELYKS